MGYTLPDPKAAKKKSSKPANKAGQSANQGTATQGWDATGASTVSYITSFLPGTDKPTVRTEAQLNKQLYDMTPAERISYATKLKAAGYRVGPINGAVTKSLRQSWLDAHSDLQTEIQAGQALDLTAFLAANAATTGGTSKGPTEIVSVTQYTPEKASQIINTIIKDTLGRKATSDEVKKYTQMLSNLDNKATSTTKYSTAGSKQTQNTTVGIDKQQYLVDKIAGTDEGKANKVLGFYETFMNALGGGS